MERFDRQNNVFLSYRNYLPTSTHSFADRQNHVHPHKLWSQISNRKHISFPILKLCHSRELEDLLGGSISEVRRLQGINRRQRCRRAAGKPRAAELRSR